MVGLTDLCSSSDPTRCFFEIVNAWPLFVPFASIAVGFVRRDIYLLAFSAGSWINAISSYACGSFSSTAAQSASWLVTMMILLIIFYRLKMNLLNAFYAVTFLTFALYANIYLEENTHGALYIGSVIGIADAVVQSLIILVFLYPYSDILYTSSHLQWYEMTNDFMSMRSMSYLPKVLHPIEAWRMVLHLHTLGNTMDLIDIFNKQSVQLRQMIRESERIETLIRTPP